MSTYTKISKGDCSGEGLHPLAKKFLIHCRIRYSLFVFHRTSLAKIILHIIVIIFLSNALNMCFGCSKGPSH